MRTAFLQTLRRTHTAAAAAAHHHERHVVLKSLEAEDKGISVLLLSRPPANALGRQMVSEMRETLEKIRFGSSRPRVLIIQSAVDRTFCAGADLKERAGMNPAEVQQFVFSLRQTFSEIESLPIPTIAAIDGFALGGGLELALACDLRVGSSSAVVGLPETSLAIIPGAGGTQRLPRLIGASKAKELIFTAKRLDAQKAYDLGIFSRLSQDGQSAFDGALNLAREILPNGPVALMAAKGAINYGMQTDQTTAMKIEENFYEQVIPTKDRLEGLAAFKEKRKPVYTGQ